MGKKAGKVPPKEVESDSDEGLDSEDEMEKMLVMKMQQEKAAADGADDGKAEPREQTRSINNKAALLQAVAILETDSFGAPPPFAETLTVGCPDKTIEFESHDDLKREVFFYHQAVAAVKLAREQLERDNIAYRRPADFFAEMLKTDTHMTRVKDRLLKEKLKMETTEKRRSIQDAKKISKQVQEEVKKSKHAHKKEAAAKLMDWRKQQAKKRGGSGLLEDKDDGLEDAISEMEQKNKKQKRDKDGRNFKREAADKKFGFGGRKRGSKRPDADSFSRGEREFSKARNDSAKDGGGGRRKRGSSKPNRPGKARRDAARGGS